MTALETISILLQGQPLLPAGRGGLILIAGGLVMVTVALFWLSVTPRTATLVSHASVFSQAATPTRRGARGTLEMPRHPTSADGNVRAGEGPRPWAAFIRDAARRSGYGSARVENVSPLKCTIRIDHANPAVLCRDEERCLRRAAHRIARGARVTEVSCGASCVFHIQLRRR